jgi:hypothetical protein
VSIIDLFLTILCVVGIAAVIGLFAWFVEMCRDDDKKSGLW